MHRPVIQQRSVDLGRARLSLVLWAIERSWASPCSFLPALVVCLCVDLVGAVLFDPRAARPPTDRTANSEFARVSGNFVREDSDIVENRSHSRAGLFDVVDGSPDLPIQFIIPQESLDRSVAPIK